MSTDLKKQLTDIRNELYDSLPVGLLNVKESDLITAISKHFSSLDKFIDEELPALSEQQLREMAQEEADNRWPEFANTAQDAYFTAGANFILSKLFPETTK